MGEGKGVAVACHSQISVECIRPIKQSQVNRKSYAETDRETPTRIHAHMLTMTNKIMYVKPHISMVILGLSTLVCVLITS